MWDSLMPFEDELDDLVDELHDIECEIGRFDPEYDDE